jgi:hypothetical protein
MTHPVVFTACCPCGHPDASWQAVPAKVACDNRVITAPSYRITCPACPELSLRDKALRLLDIA